ncbi:ArsR/SmtB family transcription factor [Novosphingobium anseongense]|uniref:ArsR/SmtB family transcription factor n=1 Tax=Novosphingobium anseongense TaxID=3133436 RepID=UPI003A8D2A73
MNCASATLSSRRSKLWIPQSAAKRPLTKRVRHRQSWLRAAALGDAGGPFPAHPLDSFRLHIEALPGGLTAGEIAAALNASPNNMSAHYAILTRAGIVTTDKQRRTVIYSAVTEKVRELSEFLAQATNKSGQR